MSWNEEISIHALREEGDLTAAAAMLIRQYFYPRPPRGGRQSCVHPLQRHIRISIHALREEGDSTSTRSASPSMEFLSTPSARRATSGP